jgi:DNA-binding transcriptional MerR regulator
MPKKYVNGILQDATADDLANLQKYQEQDELIASAKKKLQDLGLTVDEIKEAFGI